MILLLMFKRNGVKYRIYGLRYPETPYQRDSHHETGVKRCLSDPPLTILRLGIRYRIFITTKRKISILSLQIKIYCLLEGSS